MVWLIGDTSHWETSINIAGGFFSNIFCDFHHYIPREMIQFDNLMDYIFIFQMGSETTN